MKAMRYKNIYIVSSLLMLLCLVSCTGHSKKADVSYSDALAMRNILLRKENVLQLFDINDQTFNTIDTTSLQYRRLDSALLLIDAVHRYRLLADAWCVKEYLGRAFVITGQMPKDVHNIGLHPVSFLDYTNREYFFRISGRYCYMGTPGADGKWNESLDAIIDKINSIKPPLYFSNDDMMIKLFVEDKRPQAVTEK